MNKKGTISAVIYAVIIAVIVLIAISSGGGSTILNIAGTLSKIPGWAYIFLGVVVLIAMLRRK
jgi:hypothetical protein